MKLYMFEHCSLCFRVRMIAALKRRHLQETVVLDDDTETMVSLVGKRVIPILVKDDGTAMFESMDMVRHVDSFGDPVLTGAERPEIAAWADRVVSKTAPLTMPRYRCSVCLSLRLLPHSTTTICASVKHLAISSSCGRIHDVMSLNFCPTSKRSTD